MINEIILYGSKDSLLNARLDFQSSEWNGNCFDVSFHAYCTELLTEEELQQLKQRYSSVDGLLKHEDFYKEYAIHTRQWFSSIISEELLESLGLDIQNNKAKALDNFSKQAAARNAMIYDQDIPSTVFFIFDVDRKSTKHLPDILKTHQLLEENAKQRKQQGFKTVGGGLHEINPINGSNILYIDRNYAIVIGQIHCLQQFFKLDTFKQFLANVHFVRSSLIAQTGDLYEMLAKHLRIDLRYLDE